MPETPGQRLRSAKVISLPAMKYAVETFHDGYIQFRRQANRMEIWAALTIHHEKWIFRVQH
jgi:hypothetical protein